MAASDSERSVQVKRTPSADKKISIPMLRETLLNEEGLGLVGSATHAIIDYDFEFDGRSNFQETVRGIQFIFRPSAGEEDISILYLNGQDEWVQKILDHTGPPPPQNLDATILFRERLHFTDVVDDPEAQLVEINERTVRKGFEKKKKEFVERVHWLTQEFLSE